MRLVGRLRQAFRLEVGRVWLERLLLEITYAFVERDSARGGALGWLGEGGCGSVRGT